MAVDDLIIWAKLLEHVFIYLVSRKEYRIFKILSAHVRLKSWFSTCYFVCIYFGWLLPFDIQLLLNCLWVIPYSDSSRFKTLWVTLENWHVRNEFMHMHNSKQFYGKKITYLIARLNTPDPWDMSNIKDLPCTINNAKCFLKSEKNIWHKGVHFELM